jgi:hypothetical protein
MKVPSGVARLSKWKLCPRMLLQIGAVLSSFMFVGGSCRVVQRTIHKSVLNIDDKKLYLMNKGNKMKPATETQHASNPGKNTNRMSISRKGKVEVCRYGNIPLKKGKADWNHSTSTWRHSSI